MATSSILGGTPAPARVQGKDNDVLGPSDSSDSGSDVQGERPMATQPDDDSMLGGRPVDLASDTDVSGTGEKAAATPEGTRDSGDILPDHVERLPEEGGEAEAESLDEERGSVAEESAELASDEPDEPDEANS